MQDFWLLLHVLSAFVAFGAFFAGPMVTRSADGAGEGFAKVTTYIQAPALVVLLVTGILQAYAMEPREVFKETWISIAFTLWIVMAVVMFFLVRAQKAGTKAVQPLTGVMHLLLVVALWAMIWQPGAPG
jgi:magnesium-transporting ATPase (P-type)